MNTPICDFVNAYIERDVTRLHMPGHKGCGESVHAADITEIQGADVLYNAHGIIAQSEQNAAQLFGADRTVYSAEGSSLCIRAMLYLTALYARANGSRPLIAAARNAHTVFVTAAALLDIEVDWLYGEGDCLLSCTVTPTAVETYLRQHRPTALYITSPDYLGNMADVGALAEVCHRHGVLLLVDNAHGAYLKFLQTDKHPLSLGADMCCDSAHKTLSVLTGGAYLHIAKEAPSLFATQAQTAMSLFASTSPSYLILQSLDAANAKLADGYADALAAFAVLCETYKQRLKEAGYDMMGDEPLKWTVAPKSYGYTGDRLAERLAQNGIVCEFSDPDYTVMMFTPQNGEQALRAVCAVLCDLPKRKPIVTAPPAVSRPQMGMPARAALFAPRETVVAERCVGRMLASPTLSCPPAVPIGVCGELVDETMVRRAQYYGIDSLQVVIENEKTLD